MSHVSYLFRRVVYEMGILCMSLTTGVNYIYDEN
jgi:hypothetical protein